MAEGRIRVAEGRIIRFQSCVGVKEMKVANYR